MNHSPSECKICGEYHCLARCVPVEECKAKVARKLNMAKNWQATRITDEQFNKHCAKCTHSCDVYPEICLQDLQAEISFKAGGKARQKEVDEAEQRGIRKVVEHVENNINEVVELLAGYDEEARKQYHIAFDGFGKLLADWLWQAFLKGVEK